MIRWYFLHISTFLSCRDDILKGCLVDPDGRRSLATDLGAASFLPPDYLRDHQVVSPSNHQQVHWSPCQPPGDPSRWSGDHCTLHLDTLETSWKPPRKGLSIDVAMCRCKKNSRRISNLVLKLKILVDQVLLALNKAKVFYLAGFSLSLGKEVSIQHLSVDLCLCHSLSPFIRLLTPLSSQPKTRFWS